MTGPLIAPPELAPPVPEQATPEQCMAMWADLTSACEQLLLAGLREEIAPRGDLHGAYRRWYVEQMEEHDRTLRRISEALARAGEDHAG